MRDNTTLKRRIEAMEADIQRRTDTDRDKFSVRVSRVRTLLSNSPVERTGLIGNTVRSTYSVVYRLLQ